MRVQVADVCAASSDDPGAAQFEHRCFVQTSIDDTVFYAIIGVVAALCVLILALVIKNVVDRKKYMKPVRTRSLKVLRLLL
jgi:hypothetical protein